MEYAPLKNYPLTLQEFRDLLRQKNNAFLPDQVARGLADRAFSIGPGVREAMREELPELISRLRAWLDEEGIEPEVSSVPHSGYSRRETARGGHLATLLAFHALVLGASEEEYREAERLIAEGISWAKFAESHRREAFLHGTSALLHQSRREVPGELKAFEEAIECTTREDGDPEMEILLRGFFASTLITIVQVDRAEEITREGISRGREMLDDERQGYLLPYLIMNLARVESARDRRQEAILLLEEARALAESVDAEHPHLIPIFFHLAGMYSYLGDRRKTLEIHREGIRVAELQEDRQGIAWIHLQIAVVHFSLNELDLAEKALDIAEEYIDPTSTHLLEYLYTRRVSLLGRQGRYEEGIAASRKMFALFAEEEISPMLAVIYFHVGLLHRGMGEVAEEEDCYRRAVEINDRLMNAEPPFPAWFALIELLLRSDRGEEAMTIVDAIDERFREKKVSDLVRARLLEFRATYAESLGDDVAALDFIRKQSDLTLEHYRRETDSAVERGRILNEMSLYRKEAEIQRVRRQEVEASLAETLVTIESRKQTLSEVEARLREILTLVDSTKARDVITILKQALTNIDASADHSSTSLHYLQTIDRSFFERLRERYPDLTRKQEHFCGLIRSGLSSKEIEAALDISTEGVRSQRKRLRKRLGLAKEENLESVIQGI